MSALHAATSPRSVNCADGEDHDAGKHAEDDDDDQELGEREAAVAPTNGMQALTHVDSPLREIVWSIDTPGAGL